MTSSSEDRAFRIVAGGVVIGAVLIALILATAVM
jgi:hypothetical protein